MKIKILLLSTLLACSILCFSQVKLKRVVIKTKSYPQSTKTYYVIKKGEFKGERHGPYKLERYGKNISGTYSFGKKDGVWQHYIRDENHEYSNYYTKGHIDSTIGEKNHRNYKICFSSTGDTTFYQVWLANGLSFDYNGDTTIISDVFKNNQLGVLVNNKKEGEWLWSTKMGTAKTYYSKGLSVGKHESYYKNGNTLCTKNYNSNGRLHGRYAVMFENGDTATILNYTNGKRDGIAKAWYPDGKLFYEGTYQNNKIIDYKEYSINGDQNPKSTVTNGTGTIIKQNNHSTTSYPIKDGIINGNVTIVNPDSTTYENYISGIKQLKNEDKCYTQKDVDTTFLQFDYVSLDSQWYSKANFKNDEKYLQRFIAENISFPQMALENDQQGKVIVQFTVTTIGQVLDLKSCNKTLGFGLEEEAIRVLEASSFLWSPALVDGFPARMRFRIPVKYQIY